MTASKGLLTYGSHALLQRPFYQPTADRADKGK
jgi:hypothetical protein